MGDFLERIGFGREGLLWLALTLSTIACAFAAVIYLPTPTVDYILKQDISDQAALWQRRVVTQLEDTNQTFTTGTVAPQEDAFLKLLPAASNVYRFKLFKADGTVFWSTRDSDIGGVNNKDYFHNIVANGALYYKHEPKPASEIDGLALHALNTNADKTHEIAEVYVPVSQNGQFIGAIEFYTDITETRDLFIARVHAMLLALGSVAVAVVLFFGSILFRANQARFKELKSKSESERSLMDQQLHLAQEVKLLGELNEWLQSSRSLDELFDMVVKFMQHMLPECAGSIYVYSNSRDVLDGVSSWNEGTLKRHIHPEACWGLRRGRTYTYGTSEVDFVCEHAEPHDETPYFCFPILAHGETVGLMHLKKRPESTIEDFLATRKLAQMCAEQISMAIANVRMRDQLQEQSTRDPLTGLFNRRHMIDRLRHLVDLSGESGRTVHVIYLDLDHFKRFNDTHGHDAGDYVLRAVGEILEASCADDDLACRMGGEEFVMLWPDLDEEALSKRLATLQTKISGLALTYQSQTLPKITASIGVATAPGHGKLPQDILRAADEAMYDAKNNGRDQIVYFGRPRGKAAKALQAPASEIKSAHKASRPAKPSSDIAAE